VPIDPYAVSLRPTSTVDPAHVHHVGHTDSDEPAAGTGLTLKSPFATKFSYLQVVAPAWEYVPTGQGMHADAPAPEYVPSGHSAHDAPGSLDFAYPALQFSHTYDRLDVHGKLFHHPTLFQFTCVQISLSRSGCGPCQFEYHDEPCTHEYAPGWFADEQYSTLADGYPH